MSENNQKRVKTNKITLFKDVKNMPAPNNIKTRTALVDFSDAGEMGYIFGHTPEELIKLPQSVYDVIFVPKYGLGVFDIWDNILKPYDNDILTIFGDPVRTTMLNESITHDASFNSKKTLDYVRWFIEWLVVHYDNVLILTPYMKTKLQDVCMEFENK